MECLENKHLRINLKKFSNHHAMSRGYLFTPNSAVMDPRFFEDGVAPPFNHSQYGAPIGVIDYNRLPCLCAKCWEGYNGSMDHPIVILRYKGAYPATVYMGDASWVPVNSLLLRDNLGSHVCDYCEKPFAIDATVFRVNPHTPDPSIKPPPQSFYLWAEPYTTDQLNEAVATAL
jgi:hypothetical protein